MIHSLLIAAHAACAIAAFGFGLAVVWDVPARMNAAFRAYFATLSLMLVFLCLAVGLDWPGLDTVKQSIFFGLLLLGAYTGFRGWQAARELGRARGSVLNADAYVDDVGFTLIALFDGFVIVSAFDLSAPIWLVLLVGALGVVLGVMGIHRLKRRTTNRAPLLAH